MLFENRKMFIGIGSGEMSLVFMISSLFIISCVVWIVGWCFCCDGGGFMGGIWVWCIGNVR